MSTSMPTERLVGLIALERALLVASADRIARAPSLATKMFLCRSVWGAAGRVRELRRLLPRTLVAAASESRPHPSTARLIDNLTALPTEDGFVAGLCEVVAPFAAEAYGAVAALATASAARRIGRVANAHRREAACGRTCYAPGSEPELRTLRVLAADAVIAPGERMPGEAAVRSAAELTEPARERAIVGLRRGEAREEVWFVSSDAEYEQYLHQLIAFEINAFEAVSRQIAEFAWMPWEFHGDMARQISDELAHLEMWLERLPTIGGHLGAHALNTHEFAVCTGHELPGRIALLQRLIESSALDSLVLNHCLWETRQDAAMVAYFDRVQLDEIAHVRQGNKWLRRLCSDDAELLALVDAAEAATRKRMLDAAAELDHEGLAPPGNVERMRRKFDDPLAIEVAVAARARAGFTRDEIAREVQRRCRPTAAGIANQEEIP